MWDCVTMFAFRLKQLTTFLNRVKQYQFHFASADPDGLQKATIEYLKSRLTLIYRVRLCP